MCVEGLVGNLPWNLVCAHWMFYGSLPESEQGSDKGQRDRDAEPQGQQLDQSQEGNGGRGSLVPQDQVHDEKVRKDDSGTQHGGQQHIGLPLFSSEALVDPGRNVAGGSAQTHVESHGTRHQ